MTRWRLLKAVRFVGWCEDEELASKKSVLRVLWLAVLFAVHAALIAALWCMKIKRGVCRGY